MSHNIVTECPACTTRFQVTQGQLKIANGKVRCGSCLEIFNAEIYRCDDLISSLDEFTKEDESPLEQASEHKDPLFDQIKVPDFTPPQRNPDSFNKRYSSPGQDELIAEKLNSDPFDESNELEQPVQELIKPEINTDQATASEQATIEFNPTEQVAETAEQITFPTAEQCRLEKEPSQPLNIETEVTPQRLPVEPAIKAQDVATETTEKASAHLSEIALTTPPFTAFRPEPVMIRTTREKSSSWSGWSVFVILALLILAIQYLWFNRQQLSTYPELTPGYTLACEHLPCKLKAPIHLNLINTRKLIIQQQAEYQGALSVSLLLENRADFSQPFPALQLSFSDRRGQLISQRIFQPSEYLNNSMPKPMIMPAGKTIQIGFDILDPGRRALSYEASLKVPTTPF